MRLLAKLLGFSMFLLFVCPASGTSILPPPCDSLPLPAICTYNDFSGGELILTAGDASYNSRNRQSAVNGLLPSDSAEVQSSPIIGTLGSVISESSGEFAVSFSGMHAKLDAFGEYSSAVGGRSATAEFAGFIFDALATTTYAPGYAYQITVTLDASGNSQNNPLGEGPIYTSSVSPSFGGGSSVSCSNTGSTELYGALTNTCILSIPITGSEGLGLATPFSIAVVANAFSINGDDTLDLSDTVKVDQIQVVDSFGNIVPNAVIYDASGYDYNVQAAQPTPTPEPTSLAYTATSFVLAILSLTFLRLGSTSRQV